MSETLTTTTTTAWNVEEFDPRWPEFAKNPYPYYERLRSESPVHKIASMGIWFLTSYEAAHTALTNPKFGKKVPEGSDFAQPLPPQFAKLSALPKDMLDMDPPDHTRLRNLVAKSFTPQAIQKLRPRLQEMVHQLIDKVEDKAEFDVVADYAFPIPTMLISEMLGVPFADQSRFAKWTADFVRGFDVTQGPDARQAGLEAHLHLVEYFEELLVERRANPGDDLISELLLVEEAGERLSTGELLSTCVLLLFAGFETTVNLISHCIYELLYHPEQLALLRAEPKLLSRAVEEVMRYSSPVQRVGYFMLEDMELEGKQMKKGDPVLVVVGSANRDPKMFENPDVFDITRQHNPHLGFGKGMHFCLGAFLARLETEVAVSALFERLPNLQLVNDQPTLGPNTAHRRVVALPVRNVKA